MHNGYLSIIYVHSKFIIQFVSSLNALRVLIHVKTGRNHDSHVTFSYILIDDILSTLP